jgi:hypothetical protein
MSIEPHKPKDSSSLQRSEMDLHTIAGKTLRTAGARVVHITGFYKTFGSAGARAKFGCGPGRAVITPILENPYQSRNGTSHQT